MEYGGYAMMTERRERILHLARLGRADEPLPDLLRGLVEAVDLARIEGFELACDRIVERHERWRKELACDGEKARNAFDDGLGASRQTLMDLHDAIVAEVRVIRREEKPTPES